MESKKASNIITLAHGEKGGVGKSFASSVLVDKLLYEGKRVVVIDADQSNADVFREFSGVKINSTLKNDVPEEIEIHSMDLGEQNGWWDLYDLMAKNKESDVHIVVSMPAQIEFTMINQHKEFKKALEDLGYKLNIVWMLSEALDSIQLLKHTTINNADLINKLVIIKNGCFAEPDEFLDWQGSKLRTELLKNDNTVEVFLPELNKRLKRALKPIKKPYSQAIKSDQLQYSERMGLETWLDDARAIFSSIS